MLQPSGRPAPLVALPAALTGSQHAASRVGEIGRHGFPLLSEPLVSVPAGALSPAPAPLLLHARLLLVLVRGETAWTATVRGCGTAAAAAGNPGGNPRAVHCRPGRRRKSPRTCCWRNISHDRSAADSLPCRFDGNARHLPRLHRHLSPESTPRLRHRQGLLRLRALRSRRGALPVHGWRAPRRVPRLRAGLIRVTVTR